MRKDYTKRHKLPRRFFRKVTYCAEKKRSCKCWSCGDVDHFANEYKRAKFNNACFR